MEYKYAENCNYEHFASGRVLHYTNGIPNFPVREEDSGRQIMRIPENSMYIKSEDILYEIKKIQQESVLAEGYIYEHVRRGMPKSQIAQLQNGRNLRILDIFMIFSISTKTNFEYSWYLET